MRDRRQSFARILATAELARAIVLLDREIAQTTGDLYGNDLLVNFERLGLMGMDAPYVLAKLCGNRIDPTVELVVAPSLIGLVVPPAAEGDIPAPDPKTLRLWAGIPPADMRPREWSQRRPRMTAFDLTMPAAAFRAVVAAFAEITFSPLQLFEERQAKHLDALCALFPREEAAMFVELAAAASIVAVMKKQASADGGQETWSAAGRRRLQ